jgi:hypothetical protein
MPGDSPETAILRDPPRRQVARAVSLNAVMYLTRSDKAPEQQA